MNIHEGKGFKIGLWIKMGRIVVLQIFRMTRVNNIYDFSGNRLVGRICISTRKISYNG